MKPPFDQLTRYARKITFLALALGLAGVMSIASAASSSGNSDPLQTLFETGELVVSLQESQANALSAKTFTSEQLAQQ